MKHSPPHDPNKKKPTRWPKGLHVPGLGGSDRQVAAIEPDGKIRSRSAARTRMLGGLLTIGMLTLGVRSATLMMFADPQLESKARTQFKSAIEIHGRRGDILSQDGEFLATSVEVNSLHADASKLSQDTAAVLAEAVAPLLGLKVAPLTKRLRMQHRQDVIIARDLLPTKVTEVRKRIRDMTKEHPSLSNAVFVRKEYRRFYPSQKDAAPVLGVVARNGTPLAGLERALDRELHGETYKYVQWRDRKGRKVTTDSPQAHPGNDVVLTIDRRIQRITEVALDNVMERTEAKAAQAVVMDVRTGEILAMANRPTHNPNNLRTLTRSALRNSSVSDTFEPGSVFKPFVVAAAIDQGLVQADTIIDCEEGAWRIGRATIHDDHAKGRISVADVVKFSSNIGSAKLAFRLGASRTLQSLKDFGFGRISSQNIPGSAAGFLRKPDRIKPIELATTAYGHGVNASVLQLTSATAALGNDGIRMKPMLVKEVRNPSGVAIRISQPEVDRRVVSPAAARAVVDMLVSVTQPGGTGTRAAVDGYLVGGKTGTAWKYVEGQGYSSVERVGSFVGLAPADVPKLAIVVSVDSPQKGSKYGGIVAAPAFAEIAAGAMRRLGILPNPNLLEVEDAETEPTTPPPPSVDPQLRWNDYGKLIAPDLAGLSMRDALVTLQGAGLGIRFQGTGRVIRQDPKPGRSIRPGHPVEVTLQ
jgi:cell division protein FtsI (penicillin-binding protein 3)